MYTSDVAKRTHSSGRTEVGIRELRAHLSTWVDRAREGEEIVVTERGKPVARLAPLAKEDPLDRLVRLRLATPPKRTKRPVDISKLPKLKGRPNLSDYVIMQRAERHTPSTSKHRH